MAIREQTDIFHEIPEKEMHEPLRAERLDAMSVLAKQQLLIDFDTHQGHLEAKKALALETEKRGGGSADQDWLKRVSYRISIIKKQKSIIEKYLISEKADRYERAFVDVARIILNEDDFNIIHSRAKHLSLAAKGALEK